MQVKFHKDFRRGLEKLTANQKTRVGETIAIFENDPYDPILKNHALKGPLLGYRAISAGGDLRIIFKEKDDYLYVVLIRVGTHNQVY
ncbi:type II toxin-antitoxin system mRNA interferase toxin, RelE/StbE family [bacterium]|nr:type II toxin-antitoxin system mRNA interferase toxin, RelE/StbE family [bacterium]